MKKIVVILSSLVIVTGLFAGCSSSSTNTPTPTAAPTADTSTSASVATDETSLEKVASKDGSWIVIIKDNLTSTKDVVVDGDLAKEGTTAPQRLIALYNQDQTTYVKTAAYTLTAPKLFIKSASTTLKGGTFVGDVYVQVDNFALVDAKVVGNIYFASDAMKSSFTMDATSSVSGTQTIKK